MRTDSPTSLPDTYKMVKNKVLSAERSYAYATTIDDINEGWLDCEECKWYKSEESILSVRVMK